MIDDEGKISELIALAWCDKTPFEAITAQTGLPESEVMALMRKHLKPSSYRLWRKRVSGRSRKHGKKHMQSSEA